MQQSHSRETTMRDDSISGELRSAVETLRAFDEAAVCVPQVDQPHRRERAGSSPARRGRCFGAWPRIRTNGSPQHRPRPTPEAVPVRRMPPRRQCLHPCRPPAAADTCEQPQRGACGRCGPSRPAQRLHRGSPPRSCRTTSFWCLMRVWAADGSSVRWLAAAATDRVGSLAA